MVFSSCSGKRCPAGEDALGRNAHNLSADTAFTSRLGKTLSRLISAVAEDNSLLLHEIFTFDRFLALHARKAPSAGWPHCLSEWRRGDPRFLAHFLDSWITLQPLDNTGKPPKNMSLVEMMDRHPQIGTFVRFVSSLPVEEARSVIDYIIQFITPFTSRGKGFVATRIMGQSHTASVDLYEVNSKPVRRLYEEHPSLPRPDGLHPCWSFLCVAAFMAYYSATLAALFVAADMLELVEDLHRFRYPRFSQDLANNATQGVTMELASHLVLSAINKHHKFDTPLKDALIGKFGSQLDELTQWSLQINVARFQ